MKKKKSIENKPTPFQCVVCKRMAGVKRLVDGYGVVICPECENDRFRVCYAVPFTKRNEAENDPPTSL